MFFIKSVSVNPGEIELTLILKDDNSLDKVLQKLELTGAEISKADDLFTKATYDLAISTYKEASALKVDEKYPKDQILLIENKLKEIANQEAKDLETKKLYNDAIIKADGIYKEEKWEDAKIAYQDAINIKPDEDYPQQMIDDINIRLQRIAADAAEKKNGNGDK